MFLSGWFLIILTILWLEARTRKKKEMPSFNWLTAEVFFFFLFIFCKHLLVPPGREDICVLLARDDVLLFLRLQSRDLIIQTCDLKQMKD